MSVQNDTIALISMNSCGKSFHIVIKPVFQLGSVDQLWHVSLDSMPALHPIHNNRLACQSGSLLFSLLGKLADWAVCFTFRFFFFFLN